MHDDTCIGTGKIPGGTSCVITQSLKVDAPGTLAPLSLLNIPTTYDGASGATLPPDASPLKRSKIILKRLVLGATPGPRYS